MAPLGWALAGLQAGSPGQLALGRRLVRGIVGGLRGDSKALTAQHVEQVLQLAAKPASGHRTELPGATAERSFEWIWFTRSAASSDSTATRERALSSNGYPLKQEGFERAVELGSPGETTVVAVPEIRRRFRLKVIDWAESERDTKLSVLDRDLLQSPIVIRGWQPGDSFQPQGHRHVLKLKQILRENRVAVRDRALWPVLTSSGMPAWTRGCAVATEFAAGKNTRSCVLITEEEL